MGKSFDKRLRELGSEPFHTPAFADEATNMEEIVEPWLASLLPALVGLIASLSDGSSGTEADVDANVDAVAVAVAAVKLGDYTTTNNNTTTTTTATAPAAAATEADVKPCTAAGSPGNADTDTADAEAAPLSAAPLPWSPSRESGVRPLSNFLSAEHLKPGYAPARTDLP
ncbi:unnamed protein product, partial [Laminaria digitata]